MAKRLAYRLVIDADVARSASPTSSVVSESCASFLGKVLEAGFRIVMSKAIKSEWSRHRSTYAKQWLSLMRGRKLVVPMRIPEDSGLRSRIDAAVGPGEMDRAYKDAHLIEAALAADQRVVSRDDGARTLFKKASRSVGELSGIVWVNPTEKGEEPILWLQSGAKAEDHRQLGYVPPCSLLV